MAVVGKAPDVVTYKLRYMHDVPLLQKFDLLDTQQIVEVRRQDNYLFTLTLLERQV